MINLASLLRLLTRRTTLLVLSTAWLLGNRKRRRRVGLGLLAAVVTVVIVGELALDHRHLPWRPLEIDERAGLATGIKLRLLALGKDAWCEDKLEESKLLSFTPLDAHTADGKCGWPRAFHLEKSDTITLNGDSVYPMRCGLAVGAHIWMQSVDYHAKQLLGSGLARIRHFGTYSCRRINNRSTGKFSQHAFANAWDIAAFELTDGRVISVLNHWSEGGAKERFLKAAHADACRVFNVALGPEYNALHRDHFHVDEGPGVSCR